MVARSGLQHLAYQALSECDVKRKCELVRELRSAPEFENFDPNQWLASRRVLVPGRPAMPCLVAPRELERRRLSSPRGRACLVHAIAHIEFNAINLALDAIYRFASMPRAYYVDWMVVAEDEARHFTMLSTRLHELGYVYGDFLAHNGLWEMAVKTDKDCLTRMALVPRVLEARGLDVTPGMIDRLRAAGDGETIAILEVILSEEVRHVEIGTRWFRYCCQQAGRMPDTTFAELMSQYCGDTIKRPFNYVARRDAGFSESEMAMLETFAVRRMGAR